MSEPNRLRARRSPHRPPLPLAVLSLALFQAQGASAQQQQTAGWADAPLVLRRSAQLLEVIPQSERAQRPNFVAGDSITGRPDLETVIVGNASVRRGDTVINADRLEYSSPTTSPPPRATCA
jgi:LPS-assembly protein